MSKPEPMNWIMITGAYPPDLGGVADYSWVLARELAAEGDRVTIISGPGTEKGPTGPGVSVVSLDAHFTAGTFARVNQIIQQTPSPRRVLVQYVPQPFGPRAESRFKGLPLWFIRHLARSNEQLWYVMHEATTLAAPGAGWKSHLLAFCSQRMLHWAGQSADRIFYVMPAWRPLIEKHAAPHTRLDYLPVPSNIDTNVDIQDARTTRAHLFATADRPVVGHFGTFGLETTSLLQPLLEKALTQRADVQVALIGQGSCEFAARLRSFGHRVVATGALESRDVARHLAACDLLVQPFPDGASTRRGSIMAALALGKPVLSNEGLRSEAVWRESGAVALESLEGLPDRLIHLLDDPRALESLGVAGRHLYEERFSLEHTVSVLRDQENKAA